MKFCEKCGHQLLDEAVVCVNCGCATSRNASSPVVEPVVVKEKKGNALVVFNFVSSVFIALCLFFAFSAIAFANVRTTVDIGTYTYKVYANSYFRLDPAGAILTLLCSLGALGFGVVSFVLALVKKVEADKLFNSIFRLIAGILLVVLSLIFIGNAGY